MIKIRYTDLPEGLYVDVRPEGRTTVIYLRRALSRAQRRAALTKARQAALVGRSPSLPLIPLVLAVFVDRSKTMVAAVAAAARVHPAGFALPTTIVITAVMLYAFVSSVTIRLTPPQAVGPGGRPPVIAGSQGAPRGQPSPGVTAGSGAVGGGIGSPAEPPAGAPGQSGPSSPAPSPPVTSPPGPGPTSSPPPGNPAPSPSPTGGSGGGGSAGGSDSGLCVTVLGVQVCANLR